jgi:DNA-binding transcriptional regulator YiaG
MSETITWEEAEWTRAELGLSVADFARLLGVKQSAVHQGRLNPSSLLSASACALLRLAVARIRRDRLGRWARRAG